MKGKIINIVFCSLLIISSVLFGIATYSINLIKADNDSSYQSALNAELDSITKDIANNMHINNVNDFNNNKTGYSPDPSNPGSVPTTFATAKELLTHACNTLNSVDNVYTKGTGSATIVSGKMLGIGITNITMPMTFEKAKNGSEKLFKMRLIFKSGIDAIPEGQVDTYHYTKGANYDFFCGSTGHKQYVPSRYAELFSNWGMTNMWHISDASDVEKLTADDILEFSQNSKTGEYTVKISVQDPKAFNSNFENILLATLGDPNGRITFNKIAITMKFTKNGVIKTATYSEECSGKATVLGITADIGSLTTNYTESFMIVGNGLVTITRPDFENMV